MISKRKFQLLIFYLVLAVGCTPDEMVLQVPTTTPIQSQPSKTAIPTVTATATATKQSIRTLVFYGDSSLAIGDAGDGLDHVGYSFVSNLTELMDSSYDLITSNYGGRTAKWAFEHLEDNVFSYGPDLLTLWWGFDDLGGCPGIFDRETNRLMDYKLSMVLESHISYLSQIIDSSLEKSIPVFVLTPVPVLHGKLPWSHLDEEYNIVWEEGRWCDFNQGVEALAQAQRELVLGYHSEGKSVYIIDVQQVFKDNSDKEKMYMDVVHPASMGAQLIAEEWLRVFLEINK